MNDLEKICKLCGVAIATSKHHIIPKSEQTKHYQQFKLADLCWDCHKTLHVTFTNKQLAKFGNLTNLKQHPDIAKWVEWRKKHPNVIVKHRQSKERKRFGLYA